MSNLKERVANFVGNNLDVIVGTVFGTIVGAGYLWCMFYGEKVGYKKGSADGILAAMTVAAEKHPDINFASEIFSEVNSRNKK